MTDKKKNERGVWVTQAQVKLTGSPDSARFLAQCVFWSECTLVQQRSGWFYKTRDEWQAETWLSRFKQEKARKQLKAMGILQERHERRNTGIRLWYRINTGLLNRLLNTADKQPVIDNPSVCLYDQSIKTGVKEVNSGIDEQGSVLTEPCVTDNREKEKEILLLSGFSGTNVSDNNTGQSIETQGYSLNPEDYVFCHVFIYQFVNTQLQGTIQRTLWQMYGLSHEDLFNQFCEFIDRHGQAMVDWYRDNADLDVPTLNGDDIAFCNIAGRGMHASA